MGGVVPGPEHGEDLEAVANSASYRVRGVKRSDFDACRGDEFDAAFLGLGVNEDRCLDWLGGLWCGRVHCRRGRGRCSVLPLDLGDAAVSDDEFRRWYHWWEHGPAAI